jgi:hypothetical protein
MESSLCNRNANQEKTMGDVTSAFQKAMRAPEPMAFNLWAPPFIKTPPWPSDERLGIDPAKKLLTDCCVCRVPAKDTVAVIRRGLPIPLGMADDEALDFAWSVFDGGDPTVEIRCAPECGCNKRPKMRWGATARSMWRDFY